MLAQADGVKDDKGKPGSNDPLVSDDDAEGGEVETEELWVECSEELVPKTTFDQGKLSATQTRSDALALQQLAPLVREGKRKRRQTPKGHWRGSRASCSRRGLCLLRQQK